MKKRILHETSLLAALLLLFCACSGLALNYNESASDTGISNTKTQNDSINPVNVFEQVWNLLNTNYPYFEQRGIDWNALHKVYAAKISPTSTEEELFNTLSNMLEHFNDGHINLEAGKKRFCSLVKVNPKMEDFSWKLVIDKYLNKSYKTSPDSMFFYGWLTDEIAYMRIRRFPTKEVIEKYIDTIIGELAKAKGIILDIRGNPGGNGFGVAALGSRFADRKRLYEKNINRIDQSKTYTSPTYHYVEPLGPIQYKGPVILLQNVYSESGSDAFALAMRVLPNVTSIGENTGGCFATYYPEKLINGWTLSMPFSYVVDQNDFCWEGMGVPPNIRKLNTKEDIAAGNDKVLELAMDILKVDGHIRKEASGSLKEMKISLIDQFVATCSAGGVQSAVAQLEKSRKNNPDGVYLSIQEYGLAFKKFNQNEKMDEAFALLEFGLTAFPDDINTLYYLARFYETVKKQPEKAKPLYEKLATLKPNFPWERPFVAAAEKSLGK
ncbi:MAG: S41 family peptidase [Ignavibacteriales bacterium]|nr:S41 family peptidase [Ignavibacteriales bacterium]